MRLAHFFAISAALHVVALIYTAPFVPRIHEELIPVTVVGFEELAAGSGAAAIAQSTAISKPSTQPGSKKNARAKFFRTVTARTTKVEEQALSTGLRSAREAAQLRAAHISEPEQRPGLPENSSASVEASPTGGNEVFASLASAAGDGPAGSGSGNGQGQGTSGTGQGSVSGSGTGSSHGNTRLTQARYKETPKPFYPEHARREGQQGRVLLRVLVDQEGRSKSVEVSRSSGSETLDRAAVEAVRLWRFAPARYGDKPVESWVRIPVDFRLTGVSDQ